MLFTQQSVGDIPQILIGVNEIQDQGEIGELLDDTPL
jgi:hypothetical protein